MMFFTILLTSCFSVALGINTVGETKSLIDQISTKIWLVEQLVEKQEDICNTEHDETESRNFEDVDEAKSLIDQIRTKLWLVEQLVEKQRELCYEDQTQLSSTPVAVDTKTLNMQTTEQITNSTMQTTTIMSTSRIIEAITTSPEEQEITCEDQWRQFQGHCYYFSDREKSWTAASSFCNEEGSHLVIVNTEAENTYIKQIAMSEEANVWLDGSDVHNEGSWIWTSSGESFTFTDWRPGDPDGKAIQNCLSIHKVYKYLWIDNSCSNRENFICERD